jgi:bacterioferritin (cytochrome b1)
MLKPLSEMVALLNNDLKNEWKHLKFYLYHASAITGFHAHEYKEFLLEQAASELNHVSQFCDLIIGLGGIPTNDSNYFPLLTHPQHIIDYACKMEAEVVENYTHRIASLAGFTPSADTKWIEIFLEKQIEDSRTDLDHLRQILKGA